MSEYRQYAADHFERLAYKPPALTNFWDLVELIQPLVAGAADRARVQLSLAEVLSFNQQLDDLADELLDRLREKVSAGAVTPADRHWEETAWDTTRVAVASGKDGYDARLSSPEELLSAAGSALGLDCHLPIDGWLDAASDGELDTALRQGSVVWPHDGPDGFVGYDLVEHPEHGLGFVVLDDKTPNMWLVFRDQELHTRRHARPFRSVTLYRQRDRLEYFYASLGSGRDADVFVKSGPVGARRAARVYPPRKAADAEALFDQLVAAKRAEGFGELNLSTESIVIRIDGYGLGGKDVQSPLAKFERVLTESALGRLAYLRLARDAALIHYQAIDPRSAGFALANVVRSLNDQTRFAVFYDGERLAGDNLEPEIAFEPCEIHESLDYFQRLTITPHPDTLAWAVETAALAAEQWSGLDADDALLERLDAHIATLREAYRGENLDDDELERLVRLLAAAAGEWVRSQVGGHWGVGSLFTETIRFGLLVGSAAIKWWPVREVKDRIVGQVETSFEQRCRELVERADEPPAKPTDRRFTLAAGQGYFDAGVCADGRQALMAAFYTDTFGIFFDPEGRLVEYATVQELPGRPEDQPEWGPSRMALEQWQDELGFTPRDITIRRFSISSAGIGIEDLPSHFEDFLEDPESEPDEEERAYLREDIARWIENGDFVLYWGNDLWLNGNGQVTST